MSHLTQIPSTSCDKLTRSGVITFSWGRIRVQPGGNRFTSTELFIHPPLIVRWGPWQSSMNFSYGAFRKGLDHSRSVFPYVEVFLCCRGGLATREVGVKGPPTFRMWFCLSLNFTFTTEEVQIKFHYRFLSPCSSWRSNFSSYRALLFRGAPARNYSETFLFLVRSVF